MTEIDGLHMACAVRIKVDLKHTAGFLVLWIKPVDLVSCRWLNKDIEIIGTLPSQRETGRSVN